MGTQPRFEGRSVLVTGAGKGIGRATVKLLVEQGAEVVALSRSPADLDALADEFGCRTFAVDLADAEATRTAAREALPVDLLVNCAGIAELRPFLDASAEAFDLTMAVNCRAPLILSQEYARARIAAGQGGAIVNVSSISSFIGFGHLIIVVLVQLLRKLNLARCVLFSAAVLLCAVGQRDLRADRQRRDRELFGAGR